MKFICLLCSMFAISLASAQTPANYHPLDPKDPIQFLGNRIIYAGDAITLGPHDFFIDGQLSDQEAEKNPFVFNSIQSAVQQLSEGTEAHPMTLYIAPGCTGSTTPMIRRFGFQSRRPGTLRHENSLQMVAILRAEQRPK
ncbi:MAG: hypothetical protein R2778_07440 [Saprospiraceae bacterium]